MHNLVCYERVDGDSEHFDQIGDVLLTKGHLLTRERL